MTFKIKQRSSALDSVILGIASLIDIGGSLSEQENFDSDMAAIRRLRANRASLKRRRPQGIGRYFRAVSGDFQVALRKLEAEARQEQAKATDGALSGAEAQTV